MADEEDKPSFKKVKRKHTARKPKKESSNDESSGSEHGENSAVVRQKTSKRRADPMVQSTKRIKLGLSAVEQNSSSDEDSDKDEKSLTVSYKSSRTGKREGPDDMGATAISELDTQADRDVQAIVERRRLVQQEFKDRADDRVYRGINNYHQYYEKKDTVQGNADSGKNRFGPLRAPAHLRATVRWDYQPDICKDYKETGFCGFGDSCKFLHDRSDYKHGWQLEREMEQGTYGQKDDENYEISSDEESLPFRCFLCKNSFRNPIVTKCKHYFCEKCALDQYKKSKRCFACGEPTQGIFNPAKDLISKLEKQRHDDLPGNTEERRSEVICSS